MFFYLSFLRPLPQSTTVSSGQVILTPQIANDLRITYLDEAVDIFYSWFRVSSSSSNDSMPFAHIGSEPKIKLTTWHISSMYKALPVPLPHTARRGQEWRLALFCEPSPSSKSLLDPIIIDLTEEKLGRLPFPVVSMPIKIEDDIPAFSLKKATKGKTTSAYSGKDATKQTQIERFYSISLSSVIDSSTNPVIPVHMPDQSIVVCLREDTSFGLDKPNGMSNPFKAKIWERIISQDPDGQSSRTSVLELGCGTGIVSICFATLINRLASSRRVEIIATDLGSALPIINHNISANQHLYPLVDIKSSILDWDDDDTLPPETARPFDFIVMADVTYNTASFPSLVKTICNLVKPISDNDEPVHRHPSMLMAYKQRDPAERSLWDMLGERGIVLTLIDKITAQCGGNGSDYNSYGVDEEIEIWAWLP